MIEFELKRRVYLLDEPYGDEIKLKMKEAMLNKIKSIPASDLVRDMSNGVEHFYSIRVAIDMDMKAEG